MANFCKHPRHWEAITDVTLVNSMSNGAKATSIGLWGFRDFDGVELELVISPYLRVAKGSIVGYAGSGEDQGKPLVRVYEISGYNVGTWAIEARSLKYGVWCTLNVHVPEAATEWSGDSSLWPQEKKLRSMDFDLSSRVQTVLSALRTRGFQPKIFFAWRSVAVQQELFRRGVTRVKFSFHNAQQRDGTPNAFAADIVDQRWGWTKAAADNGFWDALGEEAHSAGLVWGGDWTDFRDWAHVQNKLNSDLANVKRNSGL